MRVIDEYRFEKRWGKRVDWAADDISRAVEMCECAAGWLAVWNSFSTVVGGRLRRCRICVLLEIWREDGGKREGGRDDVPQRFGSKPTIYL